MKKIIALLVCSFLFLVGADAQESTTKKLDYIIKVQGLKSAEDGEKLERLFESKKGIIDCETSFKNQTVTVKTESFISIEMLRDLLVKYFEYSIEATSYTMKEQ